VSEPDAHVVVVGAGAAGSTTALMLARYGIGTTVLERRSTPLEHPAAHVINATSLEAWERVDPGLAAAIAAESPPLEEIRTIRWAARVGDPIADLDFLTGDPDELALVRTFSTYLRSHVGQHQLMPKLWDALEREPLVDFRRDVAVAGLTHAADGSVVVTDRSGRTHPGRFAVAADGANSALREHAGITLEGPVLAHMGSAFLHAPGLYAPGESRPLLTWIYQPDFAGVLIAHADDCYILMTVYLHPDQEIARSGRTYWERTVPTVLGRDDVTIRSTGTWTMTSQMATRFRDRGLLLVGDAAHRFPHTGGFGLNSGVQDAENLAWKLHAVLVDGADPSLLDTYEQERRPVIRAFAEYSVRNHFKLDEVTRPFGVSNKALYGATRAVTKPPLSWLPRRVTAAMMERGTRMQLARTAGLAPSSRHSERLRRHVENTVPDQVEHFVATGLEFGYGYTGGLTATERGSPRTIGDGVRHHVPTTWPGRRLPHVPIEDGGRVVPVRTLVRATGLTLMTFDAAAWETWTAQNLVGLPIAVVVQPLAVADDLPASIADRLEIGPVGAVVVRPDTHVVWRTSTDATESGDALARFLRDVWAPRWPDRTTSARAEV
jgi:2,4-dichlorophenol 6-monooxygenase